jgi:hypothetical protein
MIKSIFAGRLRRRGASLRLTDPAVINRPHICGFFSSHDDEFQAVIPFILEGFEKGDPPT